MSIALLIYWIIIKVMVFVESAPKIGDDYYDPLTFESPDNYPSEDGEAPILRDQSELLHSDARKQFEGYLYDVNHCKHINGRILCGYDKNKGQIEEEERIIDIGNGCYSRGDRIECGYGNRPLNQLLRIPVDKAESNDENSDENHESTTRLTPTRTSLKTVPTTMVPDIEIQPLLLKNNLLKSVLSKISHKPNKIKKKTRKDPTKEKKPTTSTTISIETEMTTLGSSTISSKINSYKVPASKFKMSPTPQSSKRNSEATPPALEIVIGPIQPAPKNGSEQSHTTPNNHVNQTHPTSKMGIDPIPLPPILDIDLTQPASNIEPDSTSLAAQPHIDQTTVSIAGTDLSPTLSINEIDSLSNSDSSEYLSSDSDTNDNIVMLHKNNIETPAVRNRQSVHSLYDEPTEHHEDRRSNDPPIDIPETANNDADTEININRADTTATACFEKQDRVVCYNYRTEAYE